MSTNTIVVGTPVIVRRVNELGLQTGEEMDPVRFLIISCDIDPDKEIHMRRISEMHHLTSYDIDELEKRGVKVITNVPTISPY